MHFAPSVAFYSVSPQIRHVKCVFRFFFVSLRFVHNHEPFLLYVILFWGRLLHQQLKKTYKKSLNEWRVRNKKKKTLVNGTSLQWWLTCLSEALIYVIFLSDFWSWIKNTHRIGFFFFPLLLELQFVDIIDIARSAIAYFCIWLLRLLFAYEKLIEKPWSSTSPKTIQQAA